MEFTNFFTKTRDFLIRRLAECTGIVLILVSFLTFISLISYSPNDPNFINNGINEVKNILGFRGSVVSDFMFQSIGLLAYLIPFTLFFSGTNIFIKKKTNNII